MLPGQNPQKGVMSWFLGHGHITINGKITLTIIQINIETAESLVCLNQIKCFLQPFKINILFKTNRIIDIIYVFRFRFKNFITRYISIFKTLDHIYECQHNGQF